MDSSSQLLKGMIVILCVTITIDICAKPVHSQKEQETLPAHSNWGNCTNPYSVAHHAVVSFKFLPNNFQIEDTLNIVWWPGLRGDGIWSNSLSTTHHIVIGMDAGNVRNSFPSDAVAMYPLKGANLFGTFIHPANFTPTSQLVLASVAQETLYKLWLLWSCFLIFCEVSTQSQHKRVCTLFFCVD